MHGNNAQTVPPHMQLTLMTSIVVFFITWWVVLFMVLPIGIRQDDAPIIGCDVGAPLNPNIKRKLLIVTGITTGLFCGCRRKNLFDKSRPRGAQWAEIVLAAAS